MAEKKEFDFKPERKFWIQYSVTVGNDQKVLANSPSCPKNWVENYVIPVFTVRPNSGSHDQTLFVMSNARKEKYVMIGSFIFEINPLN